MKSSLVSLALVFFIMTTWAQKPPDSKRSDTIFMNNVSDIGVFLKSEITPLQSLRKMDAKVNGTRSNNATKFEFGLAKDIVTFKYTFLEKKRKRSALINRKAITITRLRYDENTTFDDLVLDYNDASFYSFLNDSNYYLIVLKPTNFTGLMSNYSLYQILDVRNLRLFEFVSFGDYPEIIARRRSDNSFDLLFLKGVHSVENDSWNIFITKHNTYRLKNQLPISLSTLHLNYKCISIVQ
jgi:hypothetical protein